MRRTTITSTEAAGMNSVSILISINITGAVGASEFNEASTTNSAGGSEENDDAAAAAFAETSVEDVLKYRSF